MKKIYGLSVLLLLNISVFLLGGQIFYFESFSLLYKCLMALLAGSILLTIDLKTIKTLNQRVKSSLPEKKKQTLILKLKRKKHLTNIVITILTILLILGNFYYYKTNQLLEKITLNVEPTQLHYQVYVLKESMIDTLEDKDIVNIGFDQSEQESSYSLLSATLEKNYNRINYQDFNPVFISPRNDIYDQLIDGKVEALIISEEVAESLDRIHHDFFEQTRLIEKINIPTGVASIPVNVKKEPFNVLIMGVDIRENEGDIHSNTRTDTLMVATINPQTMKASLISVPRDSYVEIAGSNGDYDKITHAGTQGIGCTIETVENLLDIDINYYAKFNFNALVSLVDTLGGIKVDVQYDFSEQDSHDVADAISLTAGLQILDGEQALAYARHRKTQNDHVRNESQQQVLKAILSKLASLNTLTKIDDLFNVMKTNMTTNFSRNELLSLISLIPKLSDLKMSNMVIAGEDVEEYVPLYDQYLWITELDESSIAQAQQQIAAIMNDQ